MATNFYFDFEKNGTTYTVTITDTYAPAAPEEIEAQAESPFVVTMDDESWYGVVGSSATINVISAYNMQFLDLYTVDPRRFTVKLEDNTGHTYWSGFLTSEVYSEEYDEETNYPVTLRANDGMTVLERFKPNDGADTLTVWDGGYKTLWELITNAARLVESEPRDINVACFFKFKDDAGYDVYYDATNPLENVAVLLANHADEEGELDNYRVIIEENLKPLGLILKTDPLDNSWYIFDTDYIQKSTFDVYHYDSSDYTTFTTQTISQSTNTITLDCPEPGKELSIDDVFNSYEVTTSPYSLVDVLKVDKIKCDGTPNCSVNDDINLEGGKYVAKDYDEADSLTRLATDNYFMEYYEGDNCDEVDGNLESCIKIAGAIAYDANTGPTHEVETVLSVHEVPTPSDVNVSFYHYVLRPTFDVHLWAKTDMDTSAGVDMKLPLPGSQVGKYGDGSWFRLWFSVEAEGGLIGKSYIEVTYGDQYKHSPMNEWYVPKDDASPLEYPIIKIPPIPVKWLDNTGSHFRKVKIIFSNSIEMGDSSYISDIDYILIKNIAMKLTPLNDDSIEESDDEVYDYKLNAQAASEMDSIDLKASNTLDRYGPYNRGDLLLKRTGNEMVTRLKEIAKHYGTSWNWSSVPDLLYNKLAGMADLRYKITSVQTHLADYNSLVRNLIVDTNLPNVYFRMNGAEVNYYDDLISFTLTQQYFDL